MAICTIIEAITILKVEARELGKEFLNKNKKLKKTIIITTKYLGVDWQYMKTTIQNREKRAIILFQRKNFNFIK